MLPSKDMSLWCHWTCVDLRQGCKQLYACQSLWLEKVAKHRCLTKRLWMRMQTRSKLTQRLLRWKAFYHYPLLTVQHKHTYPCLPTCRRARTQLSKRPWRVDELDAVAARWFSAADTDMDMNNGTGVPRSPWRRVIMFADNAGADIMLGLLPLARSAMFAGCSISVTV